MHRSIIYRFLQVALLIGVMCHCHNSPRKEVIVLSAAEAQNMYQSLLLKESKSTTRADSIFFGIYLTMSEKKFFGYCDSMFRKGKFKGGFDYQVQVDFDKEFSRPVKLLFYPSFERPFITRMFCRFSYKGADILKPSDRADKLMNEVLRLLMSWYGGNEFIGNPSKNPLKRFEYVKLDANRKIDVAESDNGTEVEVIITDLKPSKEISKK